jgi:ribonuclease HI
VETIVNLQPCPYGPEAQQPYNYKKTDWKVFQQKLENYLPTLSCCTEPTAESVDQLANALTEAIRRAIMETTPRADICPFSKRWWNLGLSDLRKQAERARRKFSKSGHQEDEERWKECRRIYHDKMDECKRNTWQKFVEDADERSIWKVNKYLNSLPTNTYIPTLEGTAATNHQKQDKLRKTFFPLPPAADLKDLLDVCYPNPVSTNFNITPSQVKRAIDKLASNKAPGPDGIPNHILKRCFSSLQHHILALAEQSISTGHFPRPFRETVTLVLRKPNKPNYTKPNAYRPIALENTLGKVLESIVAEHISYLCETFNLLPKHHFGGRPGRSTEDAMLILSESIYRAWKDGNVFSAILMDVSGAFNNVHHARLVHNMRKRKIPTEITKWVSSFLSDRTTYMRFNGITTNSIPTPTGIPQGSPLSPILYVLYNSDLLDLPKGRKQLGLGFIDDILYGVQNKTATVNAAELEQLLTKTEQWRRQHGAQFEKSKYMLIHFSRSASAKLEAAVTTEGTMIQPCSEAKYLGVTFDQKLKFRSHIDNIVAKGTKYALAIAGIAKSHWGPSFKHLRQLFTAVAAPRIDYAAIIWHRPQDTRTAPTTAQLQALSSVQGRIMRAITGCFRTTAIAAMEHETALPPPQWRLSSKILRTVTRMATTATNHPIHAWITRAAKHGGPPYLSNIENLIKHYPQYIQPGLEHISPYLRPPWWSFPASIEISPLNKDKAAKAHQQRLQQMSSKELVVYTDGSGQNGHLGAAMHSPTISLTKGQYVGTDNTHNVYGAELTAIQMAIKLFEEKIDEYSNMYIFVDSQSAIQAVASPKRQSGQYIVKKILDAIDRIQESKPTCNIHIEWVPGHKSITGNEQADQAAKAVAIPNTLPHTPKMRSAQYRSIQSMAKTNWETEWRTGRENAKRLRCMSQHPDTTSGPKLYGTLQQRKHVVWISRLRTGHCHLNEYLHRFNIIESAECECGAEKETVKHYLLNCELYDEERDALRRRVGAEGMRPSTLLGDPRTIKDTVEYVEKTERFKLDQR